jgi:hypothetical protein
LLTGKIKKSTYSIVICISAFKKHDQLFDDERFASEMYQRPFQALQAVEKGNKSPTAYDRNLPLGDKAECLELLIK